MLVPSVSGCMHTARIDAATHQSPPPLRLIPPLPPLDAARKLLATTPQLAMNKFIDHTLLKVRRCGCIEPSMC